MNYYLKNDMLTLGIDEHGAELNSILDNHTKTQYLWNADPNYWKRHSPILFPFVGSLKDKAYNYHGKMFPMTEHGFARDMNFSLFLQTEQEIWFSLDASEDTLLVYPFRFRLELGYQLQDKKITVFWKVINQDNTTMYFSIGAHPAFYCPLYSKDNQTDYFLCFDTDQPIHYQHINDNGLLEKKPVSEQNRLSVDSGILPINPHMFDFDALIIEDNQCHQVSILNSDRKPYLTISFDAPLLGIWSPAGKNAPFICIEPWYGRCDADNFNGSLEQREYGNTLNPGEIFEASYTIEIH